ncbi:MAG: NAD(P)-binding domain-containing protein [Myxococcales bacterium]|nr:NAD(P)-binding domain-containing protein [Myxococcales bacterium]
MKIGVLGTGMVGKAIGGKLVALGHDVMMGSRTADNPAAMAWATDHGAKQGTFADAAAHGELVFHCGKGEHALAIAMAARPGLAGKILVDLTNPLDFSNGMPPTLSVCNDDSLGERLQAAMPEVKVVKTLNTLNCELMVAPGKLVEATTIFVSGDDLEAKAKVRALLTEGFGWRDVIDLGDITTARGVEMWLPLWIRLWGALGNADFNLRVVRAKP